MKSLLAIAFVSLLLAGCSAPHTPAPQRSSLPQRIVSLAPSATEILFAVGAGSRVIATDDYSDYPAETKTLPHIGGIALNYEKIVALRPDLAVGVTDLQGPALAHLNKLGVRTLALNTTSYRNTMDAARTVGDTVGAGGGRDVANRMARALANARALPPPSRVHRVLIVVEATPKLYVAGHGTFMNDMLAASGVANAAAGKGFLMVSLEGLLSMKPELIVTTNAADTTEMVRLLGNSGLRVRVVPAPRSAFVRPGPRLADGLTWLARIVRETHAP